MWGNGDRFYWGRKERRNCKGILVVFAWLWGEESNLEAYIDLYGSLGWNSLVCHVEFLTLFSPGKATSLASGILDELVKEVNIRPVPIVLKSFSAGAKGCLYKFLQLVEGNCGRQLIKDEYQLVRECICGQIYDSSPLDFTSDLRIQYLLHPSILKMSRPPRIVSWAVRGFVSGLDAFFLNKFEEQRAEYWQTLYSSVIIGPVLLFCSKDDDLALYQIICNFAQRLRDLGGDVKLLNWNTSPHVAHYKYHQEDYRAAVSEFLTKVAIIYSSRRQLAKETRGTEPVSNPCITAMSSSKNLTIEPVDDFFLPSSMEFNEAREADEQNTNSVQLPSINPHGVLSQILFDVCVPRNVEGWDMKPGMPLNGRQTFASRRRLNPMKFIRRSRL